MHVVKDREFEKGSYAQGCHNDGSIQRNHKRDDTQDNHDHDLLGIWLPVQVACLLKRLVHHFRLRDLGLLLILSESHGEFAAKWWCKRALSAAEIMRGELLSCRRSIVGHKKGEL